MSKQDRGAFDPLAGMDLEKENAARGFGGTVADFAMLELGKASADCAEHVLDHILQESVLKARAKQLEKFKESYGTNHSIENSAITLAAAYQCKDK